MLEYLDNVKAAIIFELLILFTRRTVLSIVLCSHGRCTGRARHALYAIRIDIRSQLLMPRAVISDRCQERVTAAYLITLYPLWKRYSRMQNSLRSESQGTSPRVHSKYLQFFVTLPVSAVRPGNMVIVSSWHANELKLTFRDRERYKKKKNRPFASSNEIHIVLPKTV